MVKGRPFEFLILKTSKLYHGGPKFNNPDAGFNMIKS